MIRGASMSEAAYAALPGCRASYVKTLLTRSPAHLRAEMDRAREDTDAFRLGRALHCLALRPGDFAAEFAVSPRFDRRTKAGKEQAEAFAVEAAGRDVVDAAQFEDARRMTDALLAHPAAGRLLEVCTKREAVYTAELGSWRVPCKCRVDALDEFGLLVDIKSTVSAAPRAFARSCAEYGYTLQMAFYRAVLRAHGIDVRDVVLLAVEKAPPHAVAAYAVSLDDLLAAESWVAGAVRTFYVCSRADDWPGYGGEVMPLQCPTWTLPETDSEMETTA